MSKQLKPCPFCGGKADYDNCDNGTGKWIYCEDCGALIKVSYSVPTQELVSMWNRRTPNITR